MSRAVCRCRPSAADGRYLGDGTYLLEGVRFNMAGWWEVTLAIESGHQQDTVTFNLVLN